MKLHRFYIGDELELKQKFWVNSENLVHQWLHVLRYRHGDQLVLFNNQREERLYQIDEVEPKALHLHMVTEMEPKVPSKHTYLFWSLLKKDNNDFVLQKATELGITNFVPVIASRSEKIGFNDERARKIVIEASEQSGRADIPTIHEPESLETVIAEYAEKVEFFVAHFGGKENIVPKTDKPAGLLIGPEGGWDQKELDLFERAEIEHISLSDLTLRAETASVVGAHILAHAENI